MSVKDFIVFLSVFCLSCIFSYIFVSNNDILKIGKTITIKNKVLKFWCFFPISLYELKKGGQNKIKNATVNILGLIFYFLNTMVLIGGIVLQFLPNIPCKTVEISFGPKHRAFSFIVDTYNEKVPLLSIWIILFFQLLILLIKLIIGVFTKKGAAKKVGIGSFIFMFLIILLNMVILVYFAWLLFQ